MKCPYCSGETENDSKFCQMCRSDLSKPDKKHFKDTGKDSTSSLKKMIYFIISLFIISVIIGFCSGVSGDFHFPNFNAFVHILSIIGGSLFIIIAISMLINATYYSKKTGIIKFGNAIIGNVIIKKKDKPHEFNMAVNRLLIGGCFTFIIGVLFLLAPLWGDYVIFQVLLWLFILLSAFYNIRNWSIRTKS